MGRDGSFRVWPVLLAVTCVSLFVPATLGEDEEEREIPTSLRATWYRTDREELITFNATGTTGGRPLTYVFDHEFRYVFSESHEDQDDLITYFCWKLVRYTEVSWLLYYLTGPTEDGQLAVEAVVQRNKTDPVPSLQEVCSLDPTYVLPTMLYKWTKSSEFDFATIEASQHQCPKDLLASFKYLTDEGGCSGSDSELNFCRDRETARAYVNYTMCGTKILFSENGVLSCTASFKYGLSTYAILVNHDPTAQLTGDLYSRFVCMKITKFDSGLFAEVYPGDCASTEDSHTLSLFITGTCVPEDGGQGLMVMIIGVVVGVNVLALSLVFVCIFCKVRAEKKKKKKMYMVTADDRNSPAGQGEKGHNPRFPAILPPLEGQEVKKNPLPDDVTANGHGTVEKKDDLTVSPM